MINENLRNILLAVGVIIGFMVLVGFSLAYIAQEYSALYSCGCAYTLPVIIALLSGTGIVVGILTYYFLTGKIQKEKKDIKKNIMSTLNFLEEDEKRVVEALIKNKGKLTQAKISEKTGLGRVKAFRVVSKLESKGIIEKEKNGKTNNIKMNEDLSNVFSE